MKIQNLPVGTMMVTGGVKDDRGFSLVEVMVAMVLLAFSIIGVMGMFQWGDYGLRHGANGMRALAMAEARIEAKRAVPWESLLTDDLDMDGTAETEMRDDGKQEDAMGGDGVFTAAAEHDGIRVIWTVRPDKSGALLDAGSALIVARASYEIGGQRREMRVGTLRANPRYIGSRS